MKWILIVFGALAVLVAIIGSRLPREHGRDGAGSPFRARDPRAAEETTEKQEEEGNHERAVASPRDPPIPHQRRVELISDPLLNMYGHEVG